jgi:hypothetical protein
MMEAQYKIDRGVAMPESRGRRRKYPLAEMQVGDSFTVNRNEVDALRTAASWFGRRNGRKYSIRCVDPIKGEYRCWRIA